MNSAELAKVFKALGCRSRFSIVELLSRERLCVGAIAEKLNMSQASVSQHLRVLRDTGIVQDNRCGYHIHYTINSSLLEEAGNSLSSITAEEPLSPCTEGNKVCAKNVVNTLKN